MKKERELLAWERQRPCWAVGGRVFCAPREARLQFALLPSITGDGFWQALMAASGSLNVT